ncbi:hypothetical protein SBA6_70022 [Candidatus Sulfopaludibacter sp. SbA6]|nr:hypothetical protein SBA6_70022 [Candidatus Sulfopaludibacter sp. SbA6]
MVALAGKEERPFTELALVPGLRLKPPLGLPPGRLLPLLAGGVLLPPEGRLLGLYTVVPPGRLLPLLAGGVVLPPEGRLLGLYTVVPPGRLLPLLAGGAVFPGLWPVLLGGVLAPCSWVGGAAASE